MKPNQKHYVVVTTDDNMIGVDVQSGGYPFVARSLHWVEFWTNQTEAQKYADSWKNSSMKEYRDMTVREFTFTVSSALK